MLHANMLAKNMQIEAERAEGEIIPLVCYSISLSNQQAKDGEKTSLYSFYRLKLEGRE